VLLVCVIVDCKIRGFELKLLSLALGIVFLSISSSAALAESFHCQFSSAGKARFTPRELDIVVNDVDQTVIIYDRQFDETTHEPMFGEIVTSNHVRRTMVWHSPMISASDYPTSYGRNFALEFRLTLRKDSDSAILTHAALGFGSLSGDDIFNRAEGKCAVKK
jgi:hypothetical protein